MKKAYLQLENGLCFEGFSFGEEKAVQGEVVFHTAMVGYPEALTDPSYKDQILVLAYPLQGNYGVPPGPFESSKIQVAGLIVCGHASEGSHYAALQSLDAWLKASGVPAVYGVDTRELVLFLRDRGTCQGRLYAHADLSRLQQSKKPRVLVIDTGCKENIVRSLESRGVDVIQCNAQEAWEEYLAHVQGVLLSNGPGDPALQTGLIQRIRPLLEKELAILGICLGHQLLSMAAGAKSYKLLFGHRSANQGVQDLLTKRCYMTSQNHGYAIDASTLSHDFLPWFHNLNDGSNEGFYHRDKWIRGVQFHPEAAPGPHDTAWIFDDFAAAIRGESRTISCEQVAKPVLKKPHKVLVIGSGALQIGQAGEFDYSGSQAIKAYKEEGIETVLINPNIATMQTDPGFADKVYFLPIQPDVLEQILLQEKCDAVALSFGGQTALNCGLDLEEKGVFERLGVRVLGTSVESIRLTEDRKLFADTLRAIGVSTAKSQVAYSTDEALLVAKTIGYPLMVRSGFSLGGKGSGIVKTEEALKTLATMAFKSVPQILLEESLLGWKEIEYEVVRDVADNCITVCNMENVDPMGVHTGESVVVAPSQTLNDDEYQLLRDVALKTIRHLKIVGECNIQYALHPSSREYRVIEVNARLSRSSALASKATGYPLAYVAAKLGLFYTLPDLKNNVTGVTTAFCEPALDYVVCKYPRWDISKFDGAEASIGSEMKSVGEVMAIGRSFPEALQKAIRMLEIGALGFDGDFASSDDMKKALLEPHTKRIFSVAKAFEKGMSVGEVATLTGMDSFFLREMKRISEMKLILSQKSLHDFDADEWREIKCAGFGDAFLAKLLRTTEQAVRLAREKHAVRSYVAQIDTLAGEYKSQTNFAYMTYGAHRHEWESSESKKMLILGSGVYRIGSSVEFDWCAVTAAKTAKEMGFAPIMINCNPETVSTDYDLCERLVFDEISVETICELMQLTKAMGVVVSMGGQTPNRLVTALDRAQIPIIGTDADSIDCAEDRNRFSALLDGLHIAQPAWCSAQDAASAFSQVEALGGYPVIVRPSYVLSGAAMGVAYSDAELVAYLQKATGLSAGIAVVMSKFEEGAIEVDFDAVADKGTIIISAISEHVEDAGVHSGDATLVLPPRRLFDDTQAAIEEIGARVAQALCITGPFNLQLLVKKTSVKVIELNLRASRSFPFVSKALGVNFIELAMQAMLGLSPQTVQKSVLPYVAVKAAHFSFARLKGADPRLGVEMASTGEVACFGESFDEAFLNAMLAVGFRVPQKGVMVSVEEREMSDALLEALAALHMKGLTLFAAGHILHVLQKKAFPVEAVASLEDVEIFTELGEIDAVIQLSGLARTPSSEFNRSLRRFAVDANLPLMTNEQLALHLCRVISAPKTLPAKLFAWQDYHNRLTQRPSIAKEKIQQL